jgi:hypothetical protein
VDAATLTSQAKDVKERCFSENRMQAYRKSKAIKSADVQINSPLNTGCAMGFFEGEEAIAPNPLTQEAMADAERSRVVP